MKPKIILSPELTNALVAKHNINYLNEALKSPFIQEISKLPLDQQLKAIAQAPLPSDPMQLADIMFFKEIANEKK